MNVCVHAFAMIRVVKNHWKTDPTNQNRPKKSIPASFNLSAISISSNFLNNSVFQSVSVTRIHTMRTSQIYFFMNLLTFCKPTLMLSNPLNLVPSSHSHFLQISSITLPHSSSHISFVWNSNPSHLYFAFPPHHASSCHNSLTPPPSPPPIFFIASPSSLEASTTWWEKECYYFFHIITLLKLSFQTCYYYFWYGIW